MGRTLGFLALLVGMGVGIYLYAKQGQTSSAALGANNPKAAVNITGVRTDLMNIAQAERGYFASEGKYASLDELILSRSLTVARQRPPYSYDVETSATGFRVIATRSGDDASGTPAQLSVDQDMQFQQSQ
jgi:hypothetical protein